ncbi:hypothetical protein [Peribacillus sp. FSL E2-0159]|uniref:hypothetical protein n=1 Tax=Peribacillus sp. FSL E2-0159 TaxID=2975289 RepID=UPI00315A09A2
MDVKESAEILIALFGMVGTVVAAIAAWLSAKSAEVSSNSAKRQLEEMIQQREDSVRPELFFNNEKYGLSFHKKMGIGVFYKNKKLLNNNHFDTNLYLRINNIGVGHAKNIQIKWDFDLSSSIDFIKLYDKDNNYIIEYKPGISLDLNESSSIYLDKEFESSLPIFIKNEDYNIPLPNSYTRILSIIIHVLMVEHNFKVAAEKLPKLKFTISYYDVLNNKTIKEFDITPEITFSTGSMEENEIKEYDLEALIQVNEIIKPKRLDEHYGTVGIIDCN